MIRDIIDSSEWHCNMVNLCWRRHFYRYKYDETQIRSFVEFRLRHEIDLGGCHPLLVRADSKVGDASRMTHNGA